MPVVAALGGNALLRRANRLMPTRSAATSRSRALRRRRRACR